MKIFLASILFLGLSGRVLALNLSQFLSNAGVAAKGMQESEHRVLQNRLIELQVQEANRMAVIQQLEHQRRIKEFDDARQREIQRQQQLNIEALRREQAKIAEIKAVEQANFSRAQAAEQTTRAAIQTPSKIQEPTKNVADQLSEIAAQLRRAAPKKLNKEVSLMGASSKDDKLFLLIQLESLNTKSDPYKKVKDELQNQIDGAIVTTCLDQTLEPLTRQGAVVSYSFFDAKQSLIEAIDTDKFDCVELYSVK